MRKFLLTIVIFLVIRVSAYAYVPMACDCWTYPIWTQDYGYVTIDWTYTGGGSDCYNSFVTGNMYPWSTAYLYQNGELVDVQYYGNSTYVDCQNSA